MLGFQNTPYGWHSFKSQDKINSICDLDLFNAIRHIHSIETAHHTPGSPLICFVLIMSWWEHFYKQKQKYLCEVRCIEKEQSNSKYSHEKKNEFKYGYANKKRDTRIIYMNWATGSKVVMKFYVANSDLKLNNIIYTFNQWCNNNSSELINLWDARNIFHTLIH